MAGASLKEARQELTRQAIVDAAERVFAEQGFDGAKMQRIAAEAGVSLGTLYGAFEGKAGLYGAVHESRGGELLEHAARVAGVQSDPLAFLLAGIEAYIEYLVERPDYLRIHLRDGHAWAIADTLKVPEQEEQWRTGVGLLEQVFAQGIREAVFVEDAPGRMARITMATHQVWMADWYERGMEEAPAELVKRVQAHAVRSFCRPEVAAEYFREV